jgi:hypothetical protein
MSLFRRDQRRVLRQRHIDLEVPRTQALHLSFHLGVRRYDDAPPRTKAPIRPSWG